MKKKNAIEKYWESEKGETIKFGKNFMRCYDKAGKLQFGSWYSKTDGEEVYLVKFTIDRNELFRSDEGADYLSQTLSDWKELFEKEGGAD